MTSNQPNTWIFAYYFVRRYSFASFDRVICNVSSFRYRSVGVISRPFVRSIAPSTPMSHPILVHCEHHSQTRANLFQYPTIDFLKINYVNQFHECYTESMTWIMWFESMKCKETPQKIYLVIGTRPESLWRRQCHETVFPCPIWCWTNLVCNWFSPKMVYCSVAAMMVSYLTSNHVSTILTYDKLCYVFEPFFLCLLQPVMIH